MRTADYFECGYAVVHDRSGRRGTVVDIHPSQDFLKIQFVAGDEAWIDANDISLEADWEWLNDFNDDDWENIHGGSGDYLDDDDYNYGDDPFYYGGRAEYDDDFGHDDAVVGY